MNSMPTAFNDLKVSDGRITVILIRGDEAIVNLLDWQERYVAVTFDDVIGIGELGAIGVDLSHEESADDPLILKACRMANEQPASYRCFVFYSGWTNEPLLRVVARRSLIWGPVRR
jgi:hypothetical protein